MKQVSFGKKLQGAVLLLLVSLTYACSPSSENLFVGSGDVGNCKIPGSVSYNAADKVYTLTGSGTNIWGASDEFFLTWKEVTGDFTISAQVAFEGNGVNAHRKIGVMVRESLDGDAVYADAAVHGDGLISLQYRDTKGAETQEVKSEKTASDYVLLQRIGNKIIMKTDIGKYPQTVDGEITIDNLPAKCYVGLFIGSHEADVSETGYASNVVLIK
jgi:hypothetical protein